MPPSDRRPPAPAAPSPMWLAHHFPEDYERCVRIGRRQVCRRCLVLYPLALVVMIATLNWQPSPAVDVVIVAGFPLPAVIEFVLEHVGVFAYRVGRQVAVTALLAVGLGRGFALYLNDHGSVLFWSVVVGYGALCTAAAVVRQRRAAGFKGEDHGSV